MRERPMLFSAPMVRAILEGRKTQTRRAVKPQPPSHVERLANISLMPPAKDGRTHDQCWMPGKHVAPNCPYGQSGDLLWVKETFFAWGHWSKRYSAEKKRDEWHFINMTEQVGKPYLYTADGVFGAAIQERRSLTPVYWKRPAIFMPRHASRINLDNLGVRAERLNEISDADAIEEGIEGCEVVINGVSQGNRWRDYSVACDDPCEWFCSPIHSYRSLWDQINGAGCWDANPMVWVVEFRSLLQGDA